MASDSASLNALLDGASSETMVTGSRLSTQAELEATVARAKLVRERNHAERRKRLLDTLVSEREEMKTRFKEAEAAIERLEDVDLQVTSRLGLLHVKRRCSTRRSRMEDRLKGEQRLVEEGSMFFYRLASIPKCLVPARVASMLRLMRSRYTRFLVISDDTIRTAGGVNELAVFLRMNTVAVVISVTANLDREEEIDLADAIKDMPNVTAVFDDRDDCAGPRMLKLIEPSRQQSASSYSYSPIDEACRDIADRVGKMPSSTPVVTYHELLVADHHRPGNPYLIFRLPEFSRCEIRFTTTSDTCHKDLRVNEDGYEETKVTFTLDNHPFKARSVEATDGRFRWQTLRIPNIPAGEHTLVITFGSGEKIYRLSNVELIDTDTSVRLATAHWTDAEWIRPRRKKEGEPGLTP
jgi:hypothetical protein